MLNHKGILITSRKGMNWYKNIVPKLSFSLKRLFHYKLKEINGNSENIMTIIGEHVGSRKRSKSNRITISRKALLDEDIPRGDYRFNVMNHLLVPHHELVEIDKEEEELEPWGLIQSDSYGQNRLAKELLPKILITDPAIQALKEMAELENDELPAGWLTNRIVKIERYSRSAGSSTAYRLIVEST